MLFILTAAYKAILLYPLMAWWYCNESEAVWGGYEYMTLITFPGKSAFLVALSKQLYLDTGIDNSFHKPI